MDRRRDGTCRRRSTPLLVIAPPGLLRRHRSPGIGIRAHGAGSRGYPSAPESASVSSGAVSFSGPVADQFGVVLGHRSRQRICRAVPASTLDRGTDVGLCRPCPTQRCGTLAPGTQQPDRQAVFEMGGRADPEHHVGVQVRLALQEPAETSCCTTCSWTAFATVRRIASARRREAGDEVIRQWRSDRPVPPAAPGEDRTGT